MDHYFLGFFLRKCLALDKEALDKERDVVLY